MFSQCRFQSINLTSTIPLPALHYHYWLGPNGCVYAPYTALVRIYVEYMDVKCGLTRIGQLCFDHLFIIQMYTNKTTSIVHAALLIENLAHIIMYTSPADVLLKISRLIRIWLGAWGCWTPKPTLCPGSYPGHAMTYAWPTRPGHRLVFAVGHFEQGWTPLSLRSTSLGQLLHRPSG